MNFTKEQTEKLKRIAQMCGRDLSEFIDVMINVMSDVRTNVQIDPTLEKGVRLCTIALLQDFNNTVKLLAQPTQVPSDSSEFN